MEGNLSTGVSKKTVDVNKWLKENRLTDIEETFKKRDVSIEELIEFEKDELQLNLIKLKINHKLFYIFQQI